ncbi:SlyX family protein [Litoribacillus peritrichatus]|uniref:Protein SlyX homolog n=1 Tax=Litoribacillus peritrichatus TaxID=718191 RepID=A0ABP7N8J9_9GAMM
MGSKIEDLEIRLAFQEDTLETLNQVIIDQQKEIDKLNSYVRILKDKITSVENTSTSPEKEAPPPHY